MKYLAALLLVACGSGPAVDETTTNAANEQEIIGGSATNGFPSVVALGSDDPQLQGEFCTGTVIAPRVVLTAAHCVTEVPFDALRPWVGGGRNSHTPDWKRKISAVMVHPDWDHSQLINDIAVVYLESDAPVDGMSIGTLTDADIGKKLTVVGYGVTDGDAQTGADTKRKTDITLTELAITQLKIEDTGRSTCQGDSGGPAFVKRNGEYLVVGVTSFGPKGCGSFGVDTRVEAFVDFLDEAVSNSP